MKVHIYAAVRERLAVITGMFSNRYKPRHALNLSDVAAGQSAPEAAVSGVQSTPSPDSFDRSKKSSARASLVMSLGTLTSRLLGMIRSPMLMGAVLGLNSLVGNSFDIANKLPTLLYMIIAGGLVNAVLVPAIVKASRSSKDAGAAFINKLLTLSMVALGTITVLLTLASPLIVKIYAATLDEQWYRLTVLFALWCMPQIFFYGMYTIFGQILNARENFGPYMWAPALNNVIAIAGLAMMLWIWGPADVATASDAATWFSVRGHFLAGVHTLGIIAQAGILLIPLRRVGIRYRPDFQWRGSGLGQAGRASLWVLATMGVGMLPTIVQSNVSAGATMHAEQAGMNIEAVVGNLGYSTAYTIYSIPTSVITVSIATALFTKLAQAAVAKNYARVRAEASYTLRVTSALMFLCAALLVVLAVPVTRLLSPGSAPVEITSISLVVAVMAVGLPGVSAVTVLNRVYYALEDTRAAFFVGLPWQIFGLVGFALCGFLPPQWVVFGVGAVMAASNLLAGVVTYLLVRRRLAGLDFNRIWRSHAALAISAGVTGLVGILIIRLVGAQALATSVPGSFLAVALITPLLAVIYFGTMKALRMPEADAIAKMLGQLGSRFRRRD
ncbi:putative peptidoglycan lipid II flippase [Trueperella bonasi]|uniref:Peptidoglycan lipid II flippase n=1 Tax=Trueperella bonasi TaxID=312286 RepID=A0ABT9NHY7_9ACTO|nr:lipid II flippase MurJ [Trueperella bonasi]MDP9806802.1 putative peptidoglycan lipid II flippase [Trueperella bonasi]